MNNDSGQSVSVWMATAQVDTQPMLHMHEITDADVCVVGAGIAGLSVAYFLAGAGKSVIVLEDGPIGGGETGRTTAHLSNALDDRYFELERLHGAEGARLAADSHTAAIDTIERIVFDEGIDCDFSRLDGYLFVPPDQSTDELDRELAAAHRAGLDDVVKIDRAPFTAFTTGPCLKFPRQAQLHALKYLRGLAAAVTRREGRIFTNTHASEFHGGKDPYVKTRTGARVNCREIVVATNSPVNDRLVLHGKQVAYRSYVIGARVPRGSVPAGLYWDTADPYHYARLAADTSPDFEILIVGGEDHRTGEKDDAASRYAALEAWTREHFAGIESIVYRWSGQILEPVDALAFIGRNPADARNVYVATGDSGHGMTHGTIAGLLITDLILGRENPWAKLYDPSRKRLGAAWELVKHGASTAVHYAEHLTGGDIKSIDQLAPGSGAVVRRGLSKIAVFRDDAGKLHECSARCSHLGCIVHWNQNEKSWDCPCHGSRFDPYGAVMNGPALTPLARVGEARDEKHGFTKARTQAPDPDIDQRNRGAS
jgi:glycine/D-amino acid oxidase-like deaminating enzyme/nitrite reductase/ring-hydroxylating ferredoxin subunit